MEKIKHRTVTFSPIIKQQEIHFIRYSFSSRRTWKGSIQTKKNQNFQTRSNSVYLIGGMSW